MKACPKCGKQYPDEANFCPVDAGRLTMRIEVVTPPTATADAGLIGGRFRLGERLGGGVTGEVLRATDQEAGGTVALKLVSATVFPTPMLLQRSERELKQLIAVRSGGIAQVIAHGRNGEQLWIACELVPSVRTLGEEIETDGPLDTGQATDMVLAVGKALADAASAGVIHRDLSPKNILLVPGGIKLINFAVPVPATERVQGAPEFVAPEVVEGKPVDQRSNIYSLGALWYFALTGHPPYAGADAAAVHQQHLTGTITPPSQVAEVPADIDALVMKALERNPAKRFMTLPLMMSELERASAGPSGGAGTTAPFGRAGAPEGKGKAKQVAHTVVGMGNLGAEAEAKARKVDDAVGGAIGGAHAGAAVAVSPPAFVPSPFAAPSPAMVAGAAAQTVSSPFASSPAGGGGGGGSAGPAAAVAAAPGGPLIIAAGKKRKESAEDKGKFRETMWFKKGDLDAAAAVIAAEEKQRSGAEMADRADEMPIEERYKDDGSIDRSDVAKYSLKTGATQMMTAMREPAAESSKVSERDLIADMKGGRKKIFIAGGVGLLVLIIAIFLIAR